MVEKVTLSHLIPPSLRVMLHLTTAVLESFFVSKCDRSFPRKLHLWDDRMHPFVGKSPTQLYIPLPFVQDATKVQKKKLKCDIIGNLSRREVVKGGNSSGKIYSSSLDWQDGWLTGADNISQQSSILTPQTAKHQTRKSTHGLD